MSRYIGADPGAKGCLCLLDVNGRDVEFLDLASSSVTPRSIYQWIKEIEPIGICLEEVHSIFGSSASSNFTFGKNFGILQGVFAASGFGYSLVQPKDWQKACGIRFKQGSTKAQKKEVVALKCAELYPQAVIHGPKGGLLDGRSDALMIAHYARLKFGGGVVV